MDFRSKFVNRPAVLVENSIGSLVYLAVTASTLEDQSTGIVQVCLVKPDTFRPESIINRTFFGRRIRVPRLKLCSCTLESVINRILFGEPTCPV